MPEEKIINRLARNFDDFLRGGRLIDWVAHQSPGRIVDEQKAKNSPCTCFIIPESNDHPQEKLCFSKGVMGALTNDQEEKYCTAQLLNRSEELTERVQIFRDASDVCVEKCEHESDRFDCRLRCMSKELEKRGI